MRSIYLDNNATTRTREEVVQEMMPFYGQTYGNASSVHSFGRSARVAIDAARESLASLIGAAKPEEVVFTSGGTEADNLAIKGVAHALKSKGDHIITTVFEHHAVLNSLKHLEKEGYRVTYLPVNSSGAVDVEALKRTVGDKTILISIMAANNEVGTIQPLTEIGAFARQRGIYFHTDAVQAVGKIPFNVVSANIDLASLSGHKFNGPKGIGALYVRKGTKMTSLFHGGHHEMGKRAGTENVPGIVGIGKAASLALRELPVEGKKLTSLRDRLYQGIASGIEEIKLNGDLRALLPNTVNIGFKYLEGESIILSLDMEGVAVSTGSACTSGSLEPSHVLTAMGVDAGDAQGSIRFSLGIDTTKEDIDYVLSVLPPIIQRLRNMSPLYEKKR